MQKALEGRTALVTGGSRGIGAAICARLAADGAYVVGTATSEKGAAGIGEALGSSGEGRVLDVTDREAVRKLVSRHGGSYHDGLVLHKRDSRGVAVGTTHLLAATTSGRKYEAAQENDDELGGLNHKSACSRPACCSAFLHAVHAASCAASSAFAFAMCLPSACALGCVPSGRGGGRGNGAAPF